MGNKKSRKRQADAVAPGDRVLAQLGLSPDEWAVAVGYGKGFLSGARFTEVSVCHRPSGRGRSASFHAAGKAAARREALAVARRLVSGAAARLSLRRGRGWGVALRERTLHVATMLAVADLGRSVAFYRDRLGFEVREEHPGVALLAHGPTLLYLAADSPPTPDKPGVWLSPPPASDRTAVNLVFRVADCRAAYAELRAAGVEFLAPPQQPPWGGWRCFGRGPDGYLFEIEQP